MKKKMTRIAMADEWIPPFPPFPAPVFLFINHQRLPACLPTTPTLKIKKRN
jgi:hypothetical protein